MGGERVRVLGAVGAVMAVRAVGGGVARFVEILEVGSEDLELGSLFGTPLGEGFEDYIPFAEDLLAASEEHFVCRCTMGGADPASWRPP